jgi:hypothetical protein
VKKSAVRARIRQLCGLGVPAELLMAQLLPTLRELIQSDSAGFAWIDARGEIRNLYTERLSSANPSCAGTRRDAALRESFLACAEAPDGIVASGDAAFEYDVLRPPGTHHALFGLVREQSAALGQLCFYRAARAQAFTEDERADLASVMRYVAHGLTARDARRATSSRCHEDREEAMLVTDASRMIRPPRTTGRDRCWRRSRSHAGEPQVRRGRRRGANDQGALRATGSRGARPGEGALCDHARFEVGALRAAGV